MHPFHFHFHFLNPTPSTTSYHLPPPLYTAQPSLILHIHTLASYTPHLGLSPQPMPPSSASPTTRAQHGVTSRRPTMSITNTVLVSKPLVSQLEKSKPKSKLLGTRSSKALIVQFHYYNNETASTTSLGHR